MNDCHALNAAAMRLPILTPEQWTQVAQQGADNQAKMVRHIDDVRKAMEKTLGDYYE